MDNACFSSAGSRLLTQTLASTITLKLAPLFPDRIHRRNFSRRRSPNFGRQGFPFGPVVGVSARIVGFASHRNKPRDYSPVIGDLVRRAFFPHAANDLTAQCLELADPNPFHAPDTDYEITNVVPSHHGDSSPVWICPASIAFDRSSGAPYHGRRVVDGGFGTSMEASMRSDALVPRVVGLVILVLFVACQAPPSARPLTQNTAATVSSAVPKRATAVIMGDPPHFAGRFNPSIGSVPGLWELEEMVNAGMSNFNQEGALRPLLAEAVPTLDNGLWRLLPDGRMEITWKIRPGAVWHDGTPFTSNDLVFTVMTGTDREVPGFADVINTMIESTAAPDAATFVSTWKGPFVNADQLFTRVRGLPLPKHILEVPYNEDKAALRDHSYWGEKFIGTGPYKLRELVRGSHLILDANDKYVAGHPKIDVFEVKFTPDANVLITSLLAGSAELTLGARLSIDQALQVQNSWREGTMLYAPGGWLVAMPQFIDPSPPLLANARLRRALQHAINRQTIVDDLLFGKTQVDDAPIAPNDRDFKDVESAIARYPYDLDRVNQLVSELGYSRGSDGMFQDASGQRLNIEARTNNQLDTQVKAAAIVSDFWRKAGFNVDEVVYGQQRVADREYRHTRPAFEILGFGLPPETFADYHSKQIPSAGTGWFGQNRTRYSNPEYDALVDTYFVTIPRPARMEVLRNAIHHYTDQLVLLPLAYTTNHMAVGNRFKNIVGRGPSSSDAWNAEQWDLD